MLREQVSTSTEFRGHFTVRPEPRRRTPIEFFSSLLVIEKPYGTGRKLSSTVSKGFDDLRCAALAVAVSATHRSGRQHFHWKTSSHEMSTCYLTAGKIILP